MIVAARQDEERNGHLQALRAHVHPGRAGADGAITKTYAFHPAGEVTFGMGRVTAIIVHHFCVSHI